LAFGATTDTSLVQELVDNKKVNNVVLLLNDQDVQTFELSDSDDQVRTFRDASRVIRLMHGKGVVRQMG